MQKNTERGKHGKQTASRQNKSDITAVAMTNTAEQQRHPDDAEKQRPTAASPRIGKIGVLERRRLGFPAHQIAVGIKFNRIDDASAFGLSHGTILHVPRPKEKERTFPFYVV